MAATSENEGQAAETFPCTTCGGARDLKIATMCGTCIKTGVPFPETGDAQVKVSKALQSVQELKPGSLTQREADLFYLYGRQLFTAIDRALGHTTGRR